MKKLIAIVALVFGVLSLSAQIPKAQKNTYVNDLAHVLTKAQVHELNVNIHKLERLDSVQLAIILVKKLPKDYAIEDYSLLVGRKWHVGTKGRGLVYVASISQHQQRLEVPRNLENVFTDEVNTEILDGIKPFFRENDYASGLQNMIADITQAAKPIVRSTPQTAAATSDVKKTSSGTDTAGTIIQFFIYAVIILLLLWFISFIIKSIFGKKSYPAYNANGDGPINQGGPASSGMGSAIGGFVAGAATGYAVKTIADNMKQHENNSPPPSQPAYSAPAESNDVVSSNDNDSGDYGNWDRDSSSDSSSSSNSGFSGGGTTSNW